MESEIEDNEESGEHEEATPLCLNCLKPVDPLHHYCPHCGRTTGQLTPYIPFVNIPWETQIWGQMWRQMWSRDISIAGRIFRLFMIVWWVPIMLLGLLPRLWTRIKTKIKPVSEQDFSDNNIHDKEG